MATQWVPTEKEMMETEFGKDRKGTMRRNKKIMDSKITAKLPMNATEFLVIPSVKMTLQETCLKFGWAGCYEFVSKMLLLGDIWIDTIREAQKLLSLAKKCQGFEKYKLLHNKTKNIL